MAKKIKLTRPELKRYRDAMHRYTRYLPMLKLKQQQLQVTMRDVSHQRRDVEENVRQATRVIEQYGGLFADLAGVNVINMAEPEDIQTSITNIAGVTLPVFEGVTFRSAAYSLFGTPAWVDRAVEDLRTINRHKAHLDVLKKQYDLLNRELIRIIQRVNLFEKIKIPEAQEAIRVIRIKLGDEMASAVGRAKIAKIKLADATAMNAGESEPVDAQEATGS